MAPTLPAGGAGAGQSVNWQEMELGINLMNDAKQRAEEINRIGFQVLDRTPGWTGVSKVAAEESFREIGVVLDRWIQSLEGIINTTRVHSQRAQDNENQSASEFRSIT